MAGIFVMFWRQFEAEEREFLNPTWLALTCSRIRTAEPKWLILVSFFSGENTPSTDPSHYLQILPEVCRSVISGPPCIHDVILTRHYDWEKSTNMRANLHFLTFSQSKTVISFIILLVLQILSLSLKLNICIHKNNQCTFVVIYYLLYDASSVASFLVLGAGGQDPEM